MVGGRPASVIDAAVVEEMLSANQGYGAIAAHFGVSGRTFLRWRSAQGFGQRRLAGAALVAAIDDIMARDPNSNRGYRTVWARLTSEGYIVSRDAIAAHMRAVDPEGAVARTRQAFVRRVYVSPGFGYTWHVDTWHKGNRYGIVVAGGVDGYSKLTVYLNVADNNQSRSHLRPFAEAAGRLGVPCRTWGDAGGENVLIHDFMFHHRGEGSWRTVKSTNNTPIERFWRDLREQVLDPFRYVLHFRPPRVFNYLTYPFLSTLTHDRHHWWDLEIHFGVDVNNGLHIYCIQYMYIPLIQVRLDRFRRTWNSHRIRTKGNKTPLQLQYESPQVPVPVEFDEALYGAGGTEVAMDNDDEAAADGVPRVQMLSMCPFSIAELYEFVQRAEPMQDHELATDWTQRFLSALAIVEEIFNR